MKHIKIYLLGVILITVALICCSSAKTAKAAARTTLDVSKGDIEITKDGIYQLTGKTDKYCVRILSGRKVHLYMGGVSITAEQYSDKIPLIIESNAVVNIILRGNNALINPNSGDAIKLEKNAKLSFSKYSSGTLDVQGSGIGSGIGGTGFVYILGGTIHAKGGVLGAGIGNSAAPEEFKLYVRGGMVSAYGGTDTTRIYDEEYENLKYQYKIDQIYDISAKTFVITGGHLMTGSYYAVPKNSSGMELKPLYINTSRKTIKEIRINNKIYGSRGIKSTGYLCIWGIASGKKKIVLTYQDGTKDEITTWSSGVNGTVLKENMTLDLSKSNIILLNDGYIYQNHVYQIPYFLQSEPVTVTGASTDHQIIVLAPKQLLALSGLTAQMTKKGQAVIEVAAGIQLSIILKGQNKLAANNQNSGIHAANAAVISILGESEEESLTLTVSNQSSGIIMNNAAFVLYGGTVKAELSDTSCGIQLGNEGRAILNGGRLWDASIASSLNETKSQEVTESDSNQVLSTASGTGSQEQGTIGISAYNEGKLIDGLASIQVTIHGGELIAKSIGFYDESNENVYDGSQFLQTGGSVTVTNRMIFGHMNVTGGKLTVHLAGSGSGSEFLQFGGTVIMDRFITDYGLLREDESVQCEYNYQTGELKGSAIAQSTLYGGTLIETMKVSNLELKAISYGRC